MTPRVGICAYRTRASWAHWEMPATVIPQGYVDGVEAAGGIPLLLPPTGVSAAHASELVDVLHGLVLTGGPDLDARLYGDSPHETADAPNELRDAFELALVRAALDRQMPVLGICRGMQLLNVVRGGTLQQHLPDLELATHRPRLGTFGRHHVVVSPGTALAAIVGGEISEIHSHHHQVVREVGEGLVVSARSEDGTIDALEDPQAGFCLGVLWHPEEAALGTGAPLFAALVAAAAVYAGRE